MTADVAWAAPTVALCITGSLKMNPDAAPAMARHLVSHVLTPWSADAFVGIEITGTLTESEYMQQFAEVLRPKRMRVYCPTAGCHRHLASWCQLPACQAQKTPPVNRIWGDLRLQHCNTPFKKSPSFELMSRKRQLCYDDVMDYERDRMTASVTHRRAKARHQYQYIAYQRPELWHPSPRRPEEFALLDATGGIWVNGGLCNPACTTCYKGKEKDGAPFATAVRRTREECNAFGTFVSEAKSGAFDKSKMAALPAADASALQRRVAEMGDFGRQTCSAPSDHAAVVPRRWAPAYFASVDLVDAIARNSSFGCSNSFGISSGLCMCGIEGMNQECMLSSWLSYNGVPWSAQPWSGSWVYGAEGEAIIIGGGGGTNVTPPLWTRGRPTALHNAHCEPAPPGSVFKPDHGLHRLGLKSDAGSFHVYRFGQTIPGTWRCNSSSPLW